MATFMRKWIRHMKGTERLFNFINGGYFANLLVQFIVYLKGYYDCHRLCCNVTIVISMM